MSKNNSHKTKLTPKKIIVGGLASASLLWGCGDANEEAWKASPGTHGLINLDDVADAFKRYPQIDLFEKRINEIYEGDNLLTFTSQKHANGKFELWGCEDLDRSGNSSQGDECLFSITVENALATLQGYGANSYYHESWTCHDYDENNETTVSDTGTYHGYHRHNRGMYFTSALAYGTLWNHRSYYRRSSAFVDQVRRNSSYENTMSAKHGSRFENALTTPTAKRNSYINSAQSFKNASAAHPGWTVRSNHSIASSAGRSLGRSSGGFRSSGGSFGSSGAGV